MLENISDHESDSDYDPTLFDKPDPHPDYAPALLLALRHMRKATTTSFLSMKARSYQLSVAYIYIHIHIYTYIHIHACIYIYIYIYIYI
jgi:hypothetical protein